MMVPQNWWSGNKFMMPAIQPAGILNSNAPFAQPVSPLVQSLLQQSGINFQNNLDGNPSTDTGTADPSQGPSVDVGIGPPSGAPGTGGIGGAAGGLASMAGFMAGPVGFMAGALANKAMGRKSTAEQVMDAVNGMMGGSPGNDATGMGVGIGVAPGSPEAEAQALGLATNDTGQNTTGAGSGVDGPGTGGAGSSTGNPSGEDSSPGVGPSAYANGGVVDSLMGPDPVGPDDGYAALDRGEGILTRKAMEDFGPGLLGMMNRSPKARAKVRKALLGKG